jgi:hypothetical protein
VSNGASLLSAKAGRAGFWLRGRLMKQAYRVLAYLVAAGVILQAAFIALGLFTIGHYLDDSKHPGRVINKDYNGNVGLNLHGLFGMGIIPLLAIILFIVSFSAKVPDGVKWAGFVLLAVVVQVVLAFISFGVPAVGFLHGINALVILGLAGTTAHRVDLAGTTVRSRPVGA